MILNMTGGAGSSDKSSIIVHAPIGSEVYVENQEGTRKDAAEKNGVWTFKGCGVGIWTVHVSSEKYTDRTITVEITQDDQRMRYEVYVRFTPSDIDWSGYGTLGINYEIVDENDQPIPKDQWSSCTNWKARLLTNGTLKPTIDEKIDVFMVGAGGGAESQGSAGGGSGYTATYLAVSISANVEYPVVIGSGSPGADGGSTSAFGHSVEGGKCGKIWEDPVGGGNGGSGGSGYKYDEELEGGTDGGNGKDGNNAGGTGQQRTTREFGESGARSYAKGGNGGYMDNNNTTMRSGEANTGDGAPGSCHQNGPAGPGGSGIVVFRPAKGGT